MHDVEYLPNLPGYRPNHNLTRTNFRRVSVYKQEKNKDAVNQTMPLMDAIPRYSSLGPTTPKSYKPITMTSSHRTHHATFTSEISEQYQPSYVKLDRQVLRFSGSFKERVYQSAIEDFRVRKFDIYYYLSDNSISMREHKQENSGIDQGNFLKRQRVYKSDGKTLITPFDFAIGAEVEILGKQFLVCDCDMYTREFYENLQCPQPSSIPFPVEAFDLRATPKHVPQKPKIFTDFLDKTLGGGKVPSEKQYLSNDRKVLRFFTTGPSAYAIHFYLADDTIEIQELRTIYNGKDYLPPFLKRQKVPKSFSLGLPGQSAAQLFISPKDIMPGQNFIVYGKKFLISGCDLFTQTYYKEYFGIDFPLGVKEQPAPLKPEGDLSKVFAKSWAGVAVPPHNGYGNEDVLLADLYSLTPQSQKSRKDYQKWAQNTKQELKYLALMASSNPNDNDRRFIMTYFLEDDTVSVYEQSDENSGMQRGYFLERGKYKKVYLNRQTGITPFDFNIGKTITINGFMFYILDSTEATKNWMVQHTL